MRFSGGLCLQPEALAWPTTSTVRRLDFAFYHAHGDKVDKSQGTEVHTGGFVFLPAMHSHYLWTTTEPAVLQVTGTGPFGVDYINPADDPSKQKG